MDLSLNGKRAIILGSSQGIGRSVAIELAQLGAEVTLVARNREKLHQVLAELPGDESVHHSYIELDLSDHDALHDSLEKVAWANPVHILVNNSGGPQPGLASEASPEEFASAIQGHLMAYQMFVQTLLPGMKEAGYGRIINILSTSVLQPLRGLGVSNSLRAAVANWGRTLAAELGSYGITVNNILPGMTQTERLDALFKHRASVAGLTVEQVENLHIQAIPAARFGKPEEIAASVAFLASPAAAYISGISLAVDGGRLACQ